MIEMDGRREIGVVWDMRVRVKKMQVRVKRMRVQWSDEVA